MRVHNNLSIIISSIGTHMMAIYGHYSAVHTAHMGLWLTPLGKLLKQFWYVWIQLLACLSRVHCQHNIGWYGYTSWHASVGNGKLPKHYALAKQHTVQVG